MATKAGQWRGAWRGFPAGWQLYLTVLMWGGRRPVQWALVPLVWTYALFLRGPQRDGIDAYLARRMPERRGLARVWARFRLMQNFAVSLVDRFHLLLHGPESLIVDRSRVEGLQEKLYTGDHEDRGILVLSGHLGNADFASVALNHTRRAVSIVLYRNPTDPYFQLLERVMGDDAPEILAVNNEEKMASLAIIRRLREGRVVAMKADRAVDSRSATVNFLGGTISIPTGPFLVAALSREPALIVGCFRIGDLTYRIEASGPREYRFTSRDQRDQDLQRWAQEFADVLAAWTREYPLQWYNFFDPWESADSTPKEEHDA